MKRGKQNIMKRVSVIVDQTQAFVIINNIGMMINIDANVKNLLKKVYAIKDMLGIPVIASVNMINRVMLENIQTMKVVNVKKGWQINWWRNIMKILIKQNQLE